MRFYAIRHTYGRDTVIQGDKWTGKLHWFKSKKARDQWVSKGPGYGKRGDRESVTSDHPAVRKLYKHRRKGRRAPFAVSPSFRKKQKEIERKRNLGDHKAAARYEARYRDQTVHVVRNDGGYNLSYGDASEEVVATYTP
jgi:hypothetical protein